jgi:hypothetical protein
MAAGPERERPGQPEGCDVARMRAASADRQRAIDVLKAAFAEGRLDKDEYGERVVQAWASRTYGDLAALTADLPAGPLGALPLAVSRARAAQPQRARTNRTAIAALIFGLLPFGFTSYLAVMLGSQARREIRQTGEGGLDIAGAAIALGWVGMTLATLAVFVFLNLGGS